jgi:hypothetical protein
MQYQIVKTAIMIKGKNYPEGSIIPESILTKEDITELSNYLKPVTKEPNPSHSASRINKDKINKNSK